MQNGNMNEEFVNAYMANIRNALVEQTDRSLLLKTHLDMANKRIEELVEELAQRQDSSESAKWPDDSGSSNIEVDPPKGEGHQFVPAESA